MTAPLSHAAQSLACVDGNVPNGAPSGRALAHAFGRALPDGTAAVAVVVVAVCGFFAPFLITGRVPYGGDLVKLNYPLFSMLHQCLVAGVLPLWNPVSGGGYPVAPFSALVAYPPTWLAALLPVTQAMGWTYIFDFALAGASMVLLARRLGCGPLGSLIGALCFTFSGFMIAHLYAGHFLELGVIAWMPPFFYCLHSALATGRRRYVLLGGACLAMQILANGVEFLPFTVYPAAFVLAWYAVAMLLRAWRHGSASRTAAARLLQSLIVAGAVAGGLSAVLLLPFFQVLGHSLRYGGVAFDNATHLSLPLDALGMLSLPALFGGPVAESYWLAPGQHLYFHELYAFVGIVPLVGAVFSWAARKRCPTTYLYTAMALAAVVLALGRNTPAYGPVFALLPGVDLDLRAGTLAAGGDLCRGPARRARGRRAARRQPLRAPVGVLAAGRQRGIFLVCLGPLAMLQHAWTPQGKPGPILPSRWPSVSSAVVRLGESLVLLSLVLLSKSRGLLRPMTLGILLLVLTATDLGSANLPLLRYIDPARYFQATRPRPSCTISTAATASSRSTTVPLARAWSMRPSRTCRIMPP